VTMRGAARILPRLRLLPSRCPSSPLADSYAVVHGVPDFLLAREVSFSCLNRDVPEEELNLFEFTTGHMTEAGAILARFGRAHLFR
jgi:hypothetical protein